jgi:hypothetical protein
MSLLDVFPHTCTGKRRTRTKDGMGGSTDAYSTVLFTNKACWRQPASDIEIMTWQQRGTSITYKIFFKEDPGLDANCILEIGGDTLEVKSFASPDDSAGLGVVWRVFAY